jgi:hypothetical protein
MPAETGDDRFIASLSSTDMHHNAPVSIGDLLHCAAVGGDDNESQTGYATGLSPNHIPGRGIFKCIIADTVW